MTERRTYPKINYNGEDYVDAVFVGGEFRYAWLPSTPNMRNLLAMELRRQMRVIEGRRGVRPAQTCDG